jgi:Matrixin
MNTKVNSLELDEVSSQRRSDIIIKFQDEEDDEKEDDEIAGQTMNMFDGYGFIDNAEITISKGIYGYEFDTATIEHIAKHEMGHALDLGHANFDGNLMAERIKDGIDTISECEIRTVVEANQWRLSNDNGDDTNPCYPNHDSVSCELE